MSATPSRVYRSELRAEQAERTRRRILEAAAAEFSARGYQATTMAAIARAARVSTETVKSAGSKAELLIGGFEITFAGQEGADSLADTETAAPVFELPDDAVLTAVVGLVTAANAASSRLWTVLLGASLSDPVVDEALRRMLEHRRRDFRLLVTELVRRGLAGGADGELDVERTADQLSFLMSPEGYQQLVDQSGWSPEDYRAWVHDAVLRVVRG